ncbi:hypothetical protein Slin_7047 (plasmid) [Spirosoma linguale DSM 74]|uniref:Uncharacterized protein n=1 Tax=Spirosoma linguale (strain ATCC 33905 / DSM 74 / LMG 10896 / Claus 1) TaxID=504472 RepID=D2QW08_SPILD|nr:hypothetical protein Slin_7047 [Spirosoma linguale DSM 74]
MMMGMSTQAESGIAMMSRLLVIASGYVLGCSPMIVGGLLEILGCLLVMFSYFLMLLRVIGHDTRVLR